MTAPALHYELGTDGAHFVVAMALPLFAVGLDDEWARALARLDYVTATHVERIDGRPVRLVVTVDDAGLLGGRVEEMGSIVDRVFAREMGA
jgi:hypothetical protein